jgi:hypothetical protein
LCVVRPIPAQQLRVGSDCTPTSDSCVGYCARLTPSHTACTSDCLLGEVSCGDSAGDGACLLGQVEGSAVGDPGYCLALCDCDDECPHLMSICRPFESESPLAQETGRVGFCLPLDEPRAETSVPCEDPAKDGYLCSPGEAARCVCPDGEPGTRTFDSEGASFSSCGCPESETTGPACECRFRRRAPGPVSSAWLAACAALLSARAMLGRRKRTSVRVSQE